MGTPKSNLLVLQVGGCTAGQLPAYRKQTHARKSQEKKKTDCLNGKRQRQRKRFLRFGTWNIRSIFNKKEEIEKELSSRKCDVLVLTETKKKGSGQEIWGDYIHIWSGVKKGERACAGVSILLHKRFKNMIKGWTEVNERIVRIVLEIYGRKLSVIGAYGPNEDALVAVKEDFFNQLKSILEEAPPREEVIILGDLNARVGRSSDSMVVGRFGETARNSNGERLIDLCEEFDLKIQNSFFNHKEIHKFTWYHAGKKLKSIIDYCITKQRSTLKVEDVRAFRGPECGTDHYLVEAKIWIPWSVRKSKITEASQIVNDPKYNLMLLGEESVGHLYRTRLNEKLDLSIGTNARERYDHLKYCIHQAAKEALGEWGVSREKEDWWKEEMEDLVKQKKEAYHKWLSAKSEETRLTYRRLNGEVKKKVSELKNEFWEKACGKIDAYLGFNKSSEAWKVLKGMRTSSKQGNVVQLVSQSRWVEYYKNLYTEDRVDFKEEEERCEGGETLEIKDEEISLALKFSKNRKAAGPGGIPVELLKEGGQKVVTALRVVFQGILRGETIPDDLRIGYISSIYKKGNKNLCENYRGICVQSSVARVFGRILKNKLETNYNTHKDQSGFTAGRSCIDNIFVMRQIIEKCRARNKELHVAFIDLEKAYDNVPRSLVWKALEDAEMEGNLIRAVQKLYEGNMYQCKQGDRLSQPFLASKGLKQGCCMAPTLFKIYLDRLLNEWTRKCKGMGLPVGGECLNSLLFADDQVVIAQDQEDLEYTLRKLKGQYERWGMKINFLKTEYMSVGGSSDEDLLVDEIKVKKVKAFKYLGSVLGEEGGCGAEVVARVGQGKKATRMLHSVLWNTRVSKENKKRIFSSIIEAIVLYGSETWTTTQKLMDKVNTVETDYWRRCIRKTRADKVRNEDVLQQMEVKKTLKQKVIGRKLQWYGHVRRMTPEQWPEKVRGWTPAGRRKVGRPARRWEEEIEEEMTGRGLQQGDWADRKYWREAVMK